MDENNFQIMRAEALEFWNNTNRTLLEDFCKEIGYNYPIGYYNDTSKRTLTIYAKYPGTIIGKAGKNVELLESKLKEVFGKEYSVKFEEVRGDFVNLNNEK